MGSEDAGNGCGHQLYDDEKQNGEDPQDLEGKAAHLMDPLMVFGAVAEADQRHDALGDADADVKGDGAAFGGNAVGGGEDVAVFMSQQQAVEHGNGHRNQQHRHRSGEAHGTGVESHFAFQGEAFGMDAQNGVFAYPGQ